MTPTLEFPWVIAHKVLYIIALLSYDTEICQSGKEYLYIEERFFPCNMIYVLNACSSTSLICSCYAIIIIQYRHACRSFKCMSLDTRHVVIETESAYLILESLVLYSAEQAPTPCKHP